MIDKLTMRLKGVLRQGTKRNAQPQKKKKDEYSHNIHM